MKYAHDTESPIFSYNSEIEISAVVNLVFLDYIHNVEDDLVIEYILMMVENILCNCNTIV